MGQRSPEKSHALCEAKYCAQRTARPVGQQPQGHCSRGSSVPFLPYSLSFSPSSLLFSSFYFSFSPLFLSFPSISFKKKGNIFTWSQIKSMQSICPKHSVNQSPPTLITSFFLILPEISYDYKSKYEYVQYTYSFLPSSIKIRILYSLFCTFF